MKEIKSFKSAIERASHDSSVYMTHHLRSQAHAAGWPSHIAGSLHVSYGDKGFTAHIHEDHKEEALNLEYGTPTPRPTAAIRKAANRTKEIDSFFVKRLGKVMGK